MSDKMVWQNREYELAKNTMSIARLIDAAENSETMVEAYQNELELVKAALGEEHAAEVLGTLDIEEVDLTVLVMVYNSVVFGYEQKVREMERKKEAQIVDSPAVRAVKEVADGVRIITSIDGKGKGKRK